MATAAMSSCPLVALYYSAPHILTDILYHCTPEAFDSFRYTCKSVYSMTLSRPLIRYQLLNLIGDNEPLTGITNFELAKDNKLNLWRLRGMFLEEIMRRPSCWRVPFRKGVVELGIGHDDDLPGNEKLEIVFGSIRGDTMAVIWNDLESGFGQWRIYKVWTRRNSESFLRSIHPPTYLQNRTITLVYDQDRDVVRARDHVEIPLKNGNFKIDIYEGSYRVPPISNRSGLTDPEHYFSTTISIEMFAPTRKTQHYGEDARTGTFFDNGSAITNVFWEEATDSEIRFQLKKNGKCHATGYAYSVGSLTTQWTVFAPRSGHNMYPLLPPVMSFSVIFEKAHVDTNAKHPLYVTGCLVPNFAETIMKRVYASKGEVLPKRADDRPDQWVIPLILPPRSSNEPSPKLLLATPSPSVFYRPFQTGSTDYDEAKEHLVNALGNDQNLPTYFRIGPSNVIPATCVLRVVGYDDHQQLWLWDVTEEDMLLCSYTGIPRDVIGKRIDKIANCVGLATMNHQFSSKVVAVTYGKELKKESQGTNSDIDRLRAEDFTVPRSRLREDLDTLIGSKLDGADAGREKEKESEEVIVIENEDEHDGIRTNPVDSSIRVTQDVDEHDGIWHNMVDLPTDAVEDPGYEFTGLWDENMVALPLDKLKPIIQDCKEVIEETANEDLHVEVDQWRLVIYDLAITKGWTSRIKLNNVGDIEVL